MNFSLYIAKRYLFSKSANNAINIISRIASIGVVFGSILLLVVLSGFSGLKTLTLSPKKLCPENREYNPITRRCNNKCKKNYVRNSQFQCIRKTLKNKDCPEGMVVNTKTNRCIKFKKRKTRRSAK